MKKNYLKERNHTKERENAKREKIKERKTQFNPKLCQFQPLFAWILLNFTKSFTFSIYLSNYEVVYYSINSFIHYKTQKFY